MQAVPAGFQGVDLDELLLNFPRLLEVAEFRNQIAQRLRALHRQRAEFHNFGAQGAHVEHAHQPHDVVQGVHHVVKLTGDGGDVLRLDGGQKLLGKPVDGTVVDLVGFMLDGMHFVLPLGEGGRIEILQGILQKAGGAQGAGGIVDKTPEVIVTSFLFHRHLIKKLA